MYDNINYQLVTVKRRNEGIVSRGFFKGKDILVKNYYQLNSGDFLISKRQVVHGATGLVPDHLDGAIVSNEYFVSIENDNITTNFLTIISKLPQMYKMFFLSSYGIDIEKLVFNIADWKKRMIYIPKIDEQEQIGTLFNKLDNTIALHQFKIKKIQKIKQGLLHVITPKRGQLIPFLRFTNFSSSWEQRQLDSTGEIITGSTPSTLKSENYSTNGSPWVTPTDIISKTTINTAKKLSKVGESASRMVPANTILVTSIASIGKNTMLLVPGSFNQQINGIVPDNNNDSYFLLTMSELWSRTMKSFASSGIMQIVNKSEFSKMKFPFPDTKEEQMKIGYLFRQLDNTIALHQTKIKKLQQIKKAYLQKMFI